VVIIGYFMLNHHKLLMVIDEAILLMAIGGYFGGYFKLNYHRLSMVINGYWWLFY